MSKDRLVYVCTYGYSESVANLHLLEMIMLSHRQFHNPSLCGVCKHPIMEHPKEPDGSVRKFGSKCPFVSTKDVR